MLTKRLKDIAAGAAKPRFSNTTSAQSPSRVHHLLADVWQGELSLHTGLATLRLADGRVRTLLLALQNVGFPTLHRLDLRQAFLISMQICGKAFPMSQSARVAQLCVSHACLLIGSRRRMHLVWYSISPGTIEQTMRHIPLPLPRLLLLIFFWEDSTILVYSLDCLISAIVCKVVWIP